MLTRIYGLLWLLLILASGVLFLTGNVTYMTTVVIGFIAFGLTFMGLMGVLPFWVTHQTSTKH